MRWGSLAVALALWPGAAKAGDVVREVVSEPFPGVEITEREEANPNNRIRIARISLCQDQLHMAATAPASSFQTPGAWAGGVGVQLAVNGDFYTSGPQVYGDAVGGGMPWPLDQTGNSQPTEWYYQRYGWIAFGPDWVEFNHTEQTKLVDNETFNISLGWRPGEFTEDVPAGTVALVSGFPELVIEGQQYTCGDPTASDCFPDRTDMQARHPRTAMGLTEDRETLLLVVVDGRDSPTSVGMYGAELAELMFALGAWEAFNLNGGGSSAMWLSGPGYINMPSDGSARAVANHWGVYAGPDGGQDTEPGSCFVPGGCFATALASAQGEPFEDMPPDSYAHDEAAAMLAAGIVNGCSSDPPLYCPNCAATRGQTAVMVANAAGLDTSNPPATATFTDVPVGSSTFAHVEAAVAAGFMEGCDVDLFCPGDAITRAAGAAVVRRAADIAPATPVAPSFADVPETHPDYADIEAMQAACILEECAEGSFCPDDAELRAEAAIYNRSRVFVGSSRPVWRRRN